MDTKMKEKRKKDLAAGIVLLAAFICWTILIQIADVQSIGPLDSKVGFAAINSWFHRMTGVHMHIYTVTDWLGLVPIMVCICFGVLGLIQLAARRNLLKVDHDILLLGAYYILVVIGYLLFEMAPINYRPILINGNLEASYPSSTTLLVLSVMPTLKYQTDRRISNSILKKAVSVFVIVFSAFMVVGRMISGVHWATDIIGSVLLSFGPYMLYRFTADHFRQKTAAAVGGIEWSSAKNCRN